MDITVLRREAVPLLDDSGYTSEFIPGLFPSEGRPIRFVARRKSFEKSPGTLRECTSRTCIVVAMVELDDSKIYKVRIVRGTHIMKKASWQELGDDRLLNGSSHVLANDVMHKSIHEAAFQLKFAVTNMGRNDR